MLKLKQVGTTNSHASSLQLLLHCSLYETILIAGPIFVCKTSRIKSFRANGCVSDFRRLFVDRRADNEFLFGKSSQTFKGQIEYNFQNFYFQVCLKNVLGSLSYNWLRNVEILNC